MCLILWHLQRVQLVGLPPSSSALFNQMPETGGLKWTPPEKYAFDHCVSGVFFLKFFLQGEKSTGSLQLTSWPLQFHKYLLNAVEILIGGSENASTHGISVDLRVSCLDHVRLQLRFSNVLQASLRDGRQTAHPGLLCIGDVISDRSIVSRINVNTSNLFGFSSVNLLVFVCYFVTYEVAVIPLMASKLHLIL